MANHHSSPKTHASSSAGSAARRVHLLVPIAISVLVLAQQFLSVPGNSLLDRSLHDALHLPWFFAVTLLLRLWIGAWLPAMLAALLIGVASEGVQLLTDREASAGDMARNIAGMAAAWLGWQAWHGRRWLARGANALAAITLTAAVFAPVAYAIGAKRYMADQFPVLLDPSDRRGAAFARPTTSAAHSAEGITLTIDDADIWPGLHLTEPVDGWAAHTDLNIDVSVDNGGRMDLFVGFLLKPGDGITNFSLQPLRSGRQQVTVALGELLPSPDAPVYDVFLYTTGEYEGRRLTVHKVWLD